MAKQIRALGWIAVSSEAQAADDKFSLEKQEADIRELCQRNNWYLVAMLRVPGFSRDYDNIIEASDAMRAEGITAFDELRRHIEQKTFNLLVCRDADRFGRTLSLVAEVTAKVRRINAQIYTLTNGMVEDNSASLWSAFAGLKAQSDIERLVSHRRAGGIELAKRGIPISGNTPFSHRIIRNETGKMLDIVPNEKAHRLVMDIAALILEGVSWAAMEVQLYDRFGHVSANTGRMFPRTHIYKTVMSPTFWGNGSYGDRPNRKTWKFGTWAFDDKDAPPDNVLMFYSTHEPALPKELGEQIKAELRRRYSSIKGRANPNRTGIFTGLIVCGECGYTAVLHRSKSPHKVTHYYACNTNGIRQHHGIKPCYNTKYLRIDTAVKEITAMLLVPLYAGIDLETVLTVGNKPDDTQRQVAEIETEIEQKREEVRKLIRRQATAPEEIAEMYAEEIGNLGETLKRLQRRLEELHGLGEVIETTQRRAAEDLLTLTIDDFWAQEWTPINQQLHRLLGHWRFVLMSGHIVGIVQKNTI